MKKLATALALSALMICGSAKDVDDHEPITTSDINSADAPYESADIEYFRWRINSALECLRDLDKCRQWNMKVVGDSGNPQMPGLYATHIEDKDTGECSGFVYNNKYLITAKHCWDLQGQWEGHNSTQSLTFNFDTQNPKVDVMWAQIDDDTHQTQKTSGVQSACFRDPIPEEKANIIYPINSRYTFIVEPVVVKTPNLSESERELTAAFAENFYSAFRGPGTSGAPVVGASDGCILGMMRGGYTMYENQRLVFAPLPEELKQALWAITSQ